MDQPRKEPSPFEFDDEHDGGTQKELTPLQRNFLRWSISLAAISFFVALAGSVMGNNVSGDMQLESIAMYLNRFGMLFMLIGCIGIFVAFRLPWIVRSFPVGDRDSKRSISPWWRLFYASLGGYLAFILLFLLVPLLAGQIGYAIFAYLYMISIPLLLIMSIWHQGELRAYAIGMLTSLTLMLPVNISFASAAITGAYGGRGMGFGSSNAFFPFGNSLEATLFGMVATSMLMAVVAALTCAGYVALLEKHRLASRRSEPHDAGSASPLQDWVG